MRTARVWMPGPSSCAFVRCCPLVHFPRSQTCYKHRYSSINSPADDARARSLSCYRGTLHHVSEPPVTPCSTVTVGNERRAGVLCHGCNALCNPPIISCIINILLPFFFFYCPVALTCACHVSQANIQNCGKINNHHHRALIATKKPAN